MVLLLLFQCQVNGVDVCMNVDLRCVFSRFKVKNYFSLKCETPTYLNSNVTYKFTCQHDAARFYIGETTRHIVVRAGEHLTLFSPSQYPTAVGQHIKDCEHNSLNVLQK